MSSSKSGGKSGKKKFFCTTARFCISYTFNNMMASVTDLAGDVFLQCSPRQLGFTGKRRCTPTAMLKVVAEVAQKAKDLHGVEDAVLSLKGPGMVRDGSARILNEVGDNY